ncbi:hypothetical protein ACO0QE_003881 [Hanseniaspora vineae]
MANNIAENTAPQQVLSGGGTDHNPTLNPTLNDQKLVEKEYSDQKVIKYISNELKTDSVVRLSHINLKTLPMEAVTLMVTNNTDKLYMQKNKLESLPDNFGKLNSLRLLDLKDNKIAAFPSAILPPSVEILDISHNLISDLDVSLAETLPNLKYLNLKHNKFTSINKLAPLLKLPRLRILELDEYDDPETSIKDLTALKEYGMDTDPLQALRNYFEKKSLEKKTKNIRNTVNDRNLSSDQQENDAYIYSHSKYNDYFKRLSVLPEELNEDSVEKTPKSIHLNTFRSVDHNESEYSDRGTRLFFHSGKNDATALATSHSLKHENKSQLAEDSKQNSDAPSSFNNWNHIRNSRLKTQVHRGHDLYRTPPPKSHAPQNFQQQHNAPASVLESADETMDTKTNLPQISKISNTTSDRHETGQKLAISSNTETGLHLSDASSLPKKVQQDHMGTGIQEETSKQNTDNPLKIANDHSPSAAHHKSVITKKEKISKATYLQIKAIRYDRLLICCRKLLFVFTECQQTIRRITSFGKDKTVAMNVVSLLYGVTSHIDNLVEVLEKVESSEKQVDSLILIQSCTAIIPSFKQIFKLLSTNFDSFFQGNEICFLRMFFVTITSSYNELCNAWSLIKQESAEAMALKKGNLVHQRAHGQRKTSMFSPKGAKYQPTSSTMLSQLSQSFQSTPNLQAQLLKRKPSQNAKLPKLTRTTSLNEAPVQGGPSVLPSGRHRSSTMLVTKKNDENSQTKKSLLHKSEADSQTAVANGQDLGNEPNFIRKDIHLSRNTLAPEVGLSGHSSNVDALNSDIHGKSKEQTPKQLATSSTSDHAPSAATDPIAVVPPARSVRRNKSLSRSVIPNDSSVSQLSKNPKAFDLPSNDSSKSLHDTDQALYKTLQTVVSTASYVNAELNSTVSKAAIAHAQNVSSNDESSKSSELLAPKIKLLMGTCVSCMDLSTHMKSRLAILMQNEASLISPIEKRKTWELVNTFLKSIIALLGNAKSVINEVDGFGDLRPGLGNLAKVTKEVTLILNNSSYKNAGSIPTSQIITKDTKGTSSYGPPPAQQNSQTTASSGVYTSVFPDLKTTPSVASASAPAMNYFDQH